MTRGWADVSGGEAAEREAAEREAAEERRRARRHARRAGREAEGAPLAEVLSGFTSISARGTRRRPAPLAAESPAADLAPASTEPRADPDATAPEARRPDASDPPAGAPHAPGVSEPAPDRPAPPSADPGDVASDAPPLPPPEAEVPALFDALPAEPDAPDLGEDLADADFAVFQDTPSDSFAMPVDAFPTEGELEAEPPAEEPDAPAAPASSLLDELFPSSEGPEAWGSDLGAASAGATAAGLGLDDSDPAQVAAASPAVPAAVQASGPPPPPAAAAPPPTRRFGAGSWALLALSVGAIAVAALWPRLAGAPERPSGPTVGGGGFGDTLGDAAEAAFRDSVAQLDPTARDSALAARDSARTLPARADAPDSAYVPVPIPPDAAPPPTPDAPAGQRTLGVAPPAGTAILPPRVAGLTSTQTQALASRDGLALGRGTTWVVLSTPGRDEAAALAERYRRSGYRADVIRTTAAGRTTFRVGVGQFPSRDDAVALRSRLPPQAPADTWPLDLAAPGLSL